MHAFYESLKLNNKTPVLLCVFAIYIIAYWFLPTSGHSWDNYCWGLWSSEMKTKGLFYAYDKGSVINYLPLYVYVLYFYSLLCDSVQTCFENVHLIRLFTLLFDLGSLILITQFIRGSLKKILLILLGVANLGLIYNTYFWGQVDSIFTFFLVLSLLSILKRKPTLSILAYILAINFKLQAIAFLPIFAILWIAYIPKRKYIPLILYAVGLQLLILLPFIINGSAKNIISVAIYSVDYFKSISMNAFNIWYLILSGDLMQTNDQDIFYIFCYKQIGLFLYCLSLLCTLLPLIILIWRKKTITLKFYILVYILVGYCFFYFNTQMHERYIHPVIIGSTILAFYYKDWLVWAILTLNYLFTLDEIVCSLGINYTEYSMIFNPRVHSTIYTIILVYYFISFGIEYFKILKSVSQSTLHNTFSDTNFSV